MTDSAASFMAVIFGLGVFAVIVAVGWRSVQNRRIVRLQDADGHETIIVAREDDDISSIVTTTDSSQAVPAPTVLNLDEDLSEPTPAYEHDRRASESETAVDAKVDVAGRNRLRRVVSSAN